MKKFECKKLMNYREKLSGAMGGIFWLGRDAERILGDIEFGTLFAYLFRRFGYPVTGWDGHKELAGYYLTTPIKGVYLNVSPRPSGIEHSFGYMLNRKMLYKCEYEDRKHVFEMHKAVIMFAKNEHNDLFCEHGDDNKKIEKTGMLWLKEKYPKLLEGKKIPKETIEEFWDEQHEKRDKYYELFRKKYPGKVPRPSSYSRGEQMVYRKGTILCEVHNALKTAIKDLLRPVNVRDVYFNVRGRDESYKNTVYPSPEAGYGIDIKYINKEILDKKINKSKERKCRK